MPQSIAVKNNLAELRPSVAVDWHPTKNGEITASMVSYGSKKPAWWFVKECGHEWKSTINARTKIDTRTKKVTGCSVCAGKTVCAGFNDLASRFPDIVKEWHPTKNGDITPDMVVYGSTVSFWWIGECGHEWEANPNNRTNGGHRCGICFGKVVYKGLNDLASKAPLIAKEWHPTKNGDITPEMVTFKAGKKVWWLGECGHEWYALISNRVALGNGCSFCPKGKQERSFIEAFSELSNFEFCSENLPNLPRRFRKHHHIQVDGINKILKLIIEFDGEWTHGRRNPEKKDYSQKLLDDADSTEVLLNAGYKVIRIREQNRYRSLAFIELDEQHLSHANLSENLYQISFKGNGFPLNERENIHAVVNRILSEKADWFSVAI